MRFCLNGRVVYGLVLIYCVFYVVANIYNVERMIAVSLTTCICFFVLFQITWKIANHCYYIYFKTMQSIELNPIYYFSNEILEFLRCWCLYKKVNSLLF